MESAISIGLIVNELVTNSIKHAFVNHDHPEFTLEVKYENHRIMIECSDNGPGFQLSGQSNGFGLRLLGLLLKKVNGTIEQMDPRRLRIGVKTFTINK